MPEKINIAIQNFYTLLTINEIFKLTDIKMQSKVMQYPMAFCSVVFTTSTNTTLASSVVENVE